MTEKRTYRTPEIESKPTYIPEVLTQYYKAESLHTQHVEKLSEETIRSTFVFPEYQRTLENLGHVSMAQMHEALLEALTSCLQNAFESTPEQFNIDTEKYLEQANDALYKHENIEFTKMLQSGEAAVLTTTLSSVESSDTGRFQKAIFQFDGFMKGNVVCLLPVI